VRVHGALDAFMAAHAPRGTPDSFARLAQALSASRAPAGSRKVV
jgi:hypothetical protein